ncbi:MAG: Endoglucanase E precursor [Firmicutes bacterium ADurb.Bin419]|nr:MAG: Endoglucanase E precursor [Firmicutes bacterium ADurb.Bin419]
MLKFIRFFLLFVIALLITQGINAFGFSGVVFAGEEIEFNEPSFVYGDVTGDGKINSIDFATMKQYLLGIIKQFKFEYGIKAADVDGNGVFNSIDFAYMKQYLLRLINDFPVNISTPTAAPTVVSTATPTVVPTATKGVTPTPLSEEFCQLSPTNIEVDIIDSESISISWDEVEGAIVYEIYRDEVIVDTTLIPRYGDSGLEEGKDYKYYIRAVNKEGQKSLESSEIIVNTGDVSLNSDTILSENRFYKGLHIDYGASLDLNGYTLNVKLDLYEISGKVNVNTGKLIVGRDYSIGEYGIIVMKNEADYVYVGGNFVTSNDYNVGVDEEDYLTAGTLEVKGNFSCIGEYGGFNASGSHKVILSGDGEQVVSNIETALEFNELEIANETGVRFESPIGIRKMQGTYKVVGELVLSRVESVIGDVTVEGDLKLISGVLDLCGYKYTVTGDFTQVSEMVSSRVKVNMGILEIYGDCFVGTQKETYDRYSMLQMINEEDFVYVGGDFTIASGYSYAYEFNQDRSEREYLSAGTMEIKGDFNCLKVDCFSASGNHKVILSGNSEQIVNNSYMEDEILYPSFLIFNELEIKNEAGVRFDNPVGIKKMKGNYKVISELGLAVEFPLAGDVKIEGDLKYVGANLDLNGYSLIVTGNLSQVSGYNNSIFSVNKGRLEVYGNYSISTDVEFNDYSYAALKMTNESDYVYVGGNFTTYSVADHTGYLTAGTLEVKGDFTQGAINGHPMNFAASGTHKTVLSGDTVQTVTFNNPEVSSFNILKLTKPIDAGYIFNTTPVWKLLEK